ncbi:putative ORFan [Cotonvirus japonicus]|uniref:ORFan n=1 Tax=Cotonvirus japonicus TaxID=2811091 RepID=A0ABM7NRS2_9VIRU|nr:putative ORFan [Cotonvirus japonicus]BCS82850.1 putative ORFan [Cotonvirus japonicus]
MNWFNFNRYINNTTIEIIMNIIVIDESYNEHDNQTNITKSVVDRLWILVKYAVNVWFDNTIDDPIDYSESELTVLAEVFDVEDTLNLII